MSILETLRREPVRLYLYGIGAAVVAFLVGIGVLSTSIAPLVIAIVVAALAVPSPVESLRNKVSPVETTYQVTIIDSESSEGPTARAERINPDAQG